MTDYTISADPYSNVAHVVGNVITEITNYLEVKEANITERKRISAALETATKIIEGETERFKLYIENEYKDKDRLYVSAEKLIDRGLEENNVTIISIGCNLMLNVFSKNPLKDYESQIDFTKLTSGFFQTNFNKMIEYK